MGDWLANLEPLLRDYGLPVLFGGVFLESMGLPLPGETLILLSSGLAALGDMNIYAVAVTAFCAAVLGDNIGYLVGRKLGRPFVIHYGSRFGITHERLDRVERVIERRGAPMVALARFFVVLRQLNGIAAGTAGMRWPKFLLANMTGAALWVGLWATLAYEFGHDVTILPALWTHLSGAVPYVVGAVVGLLVVGWFVYRGNLRAKR